MSRSWGPPARSTGGGTARVSSGRGGGRHAGVGHGWARARVMELGGAAVAEEARGGGGEDERRRLAAAAARGGTRGRRHGPVEVEVGAAAWQRGRAGRWQGRSLGWRWWSASEVEEPCRRGRVRGGDDAVGGGRRRAGGRQGGWCGMRRMWGSGREEEDAATGESSGRKGMKKKERKKEKKRREKRREGKKKEKGGGRPFSRNDGNGGGWLQKGRGRERKTARGNPRVWKIGGLWAGLGYSLSILKTFSFAN